MAKISHKLSNSLEGALAGGGDPATSPLYVFGPFLRLIVVAGVAQVTFGASIWLVVLTIATVSAMYRLVMSWITDGSGGSGLNEEEFGRWAVKVNAAITFVEYTLTFLVSMAAMVTFIADRFPLLNNSVVGIQYRTMVAILLSVLTGWLVNRGPKTASRAFGPATAGVLLLLWFMVGATIVKLGFRLPDFQLAAFRPPNLHYTLGGYARILAVMTGIEVFANLVAAYDGTPQQKSRRAFGSLLIIMGTTVITMVVVGPAILELADPTNEHVSVFTQTMDLLLPQPLAYLGTLVGIAVLLSASAASAQGLQNLALGLKNRNYIPAVIGRRNAFDVADWPVWIEVGIVSVVFLLFGTREETYLAIYAAGVFILLSMTGWAAAKRLIRMTRQQFSMAGLAAIVGTLIAAVLTTGATVIIFGERFREGAWTYLLFIPVLYAFFSYFRNRLGTPSPMVERLGQLEKAMVGGFGLGQTGFGAAVPVGAGVSERAGQAETVPRRRREIPRIQLQRIVVPLDGSGFAEEAIPLAELICSQTAARLTLLSAVAISSANGDTPDTAESSSRKGYLGAMAETLRARGLEVDYQIQAGSVAEAVAGLVRRDGVDLIVTSTRGESGVAHWLSGGVARKIINLVDRPVLLVQAEDQLNGRRRPIQKILVNLDGSEIAERALPHAVAMAQLFESELVLLSVPEIPEAEKYGMMSDLVEEMRRTAEAELRHYLEVVAEDLREPDLQVRPIVTGSLPARTIHAVGEAESVDLIIMTTRGRGGLDRLLMGSVAERVVQLTQRPVFLVPVRQLQLAEAAPLSETGGAQAA